MVKTCSNCGICLGCQKRFGKPADHVCDDWKNGEDIIINIRKEFIAQVRHAVWVGFQIGVGQDYNIEMNEDQRESLYDGIDYADNNSNRTPENNHENWMKEKIKQGWVYGPIKSFEKKEHPDLVPFNELPEIEQRKDIMDCIAHNMAVKLWKN